MWNDFSFFFYHPVCTEQLYRVFIWIIMNHISLQSVNNLSIETRKIVKGNHSRKTAAFVRVSYYGNILMEENPISSTSLQTTSKFFSELISRFVIELDQSMHLVHLCKIDCFDNFTDPWSSTQILKTWRKEIFLCLFSCFFVLFAEYGDSAFIIKILFKKCSKAK